MDILKTLQALNACHGPAGDEAQVAAKLRELAAPYVDECRVDTLGNLICRKKGSGPRVDRPLPHIRLDAALEFLIGDKLR